jgi:hypothetical protein
MQVRQSVVQVINDVQTDDDALEHRDDRHNFYLLIVRVDANNGACLVSRYRLVLPSAPRPPGILTARRPGWGSCRCNTEYTRSRRRRQSAQSSANQATRAYRAPRGTRPTPGRAHAAGRASGSAHDETYG